MSWLPNRRYECGVPPVHRTCARGDLDTVRSLILSMRGDSDETYNDGAAADVVAMVNQRSPRLSRTPLIEAAAAGHEAVVQWLIEQGADTDSTDVIGRSALFVAMRMGPHLAVMRRLLEAGCDVDQAESGGITPLFWAVQMGKADAVQVALFAP